MFKVSLVATPIFNRFQAKRQLPLGIIKIGTIALLNNCDIQYIDPCCILKSKNIKNADDIRSFVANRIIIDNPDLIGFSTMCNSFQDSILIAKKCKERLGSNTTVVFGGPQASAVAENLIKSFPFIDYVIVGEGEETFITLINYKIACLQKRYGNENQRLPKVLFAQNKIDLDNSVIPQYYKYPNWDSLKNQEDLPIELSRGCLHACDFCYGPKFWNKSKREKSIDKAIEEIVFYNEIHNVTKFALVQDNFTAYRKRAREFCQKLSKLNRNVYWNCLGSPETINEEILSTMRNAGCNGLFLGMESGNEKIRKNHTKNFNQDKVLRCIEYGTKIGIDITCSFIIGFPEETEDQVYSTIDLFRRTLEAGASFAGIDLLCPIPGSQIYLKNKNLLDNDGIYSELANGGLPKDEEAFLLIKDNPELFPQFCYINSGIERKKLLAYYFVSKALRPQKL